MGYEAQVVYRFDHPEAIVDDEVVAPDATMTIVGYESGGAGAGLAFDGQGRLWIPLYPAFVRLDEPWAPLGTVDVEPDAALEQVVGVRIGFLYRDGSLYLGRFDTDTVLRYDDVDTVQGAHPVTWSALIGVSAFHVEVITLDASGRFWLATAIPTRVSRYPDLSSLADGSTVTPHVVISHDHATALFFNDAGQD
jgi:hypothetical protein